MNTILDFDYISLSDPNDPVDPEAPVEEEDKEDDDEGGDDEKTVESDDAS